MRAVLGKINLEHPFFDYLAQSEKDMIGVLIKARQSHIVGFQDENEVFIFAAVIDILPDRIHVREVGGHFVKAIEWLEKYCVKINEVYKREFISFCTKRVGVETIGARLGFKPSPWAGEYQKKVR